MCKLEFKSLSQFFQSRWHFSIHAKLRSTTQRLGMTSNLCNSLRLATLTEAPMRCSTPSAVNVKVVVA